MIGWNYFLKNIFLTLETDVPHKKNLPWDDWRIIINNNIVGSNRVKEK